MAKGSNIFVYVGLCWSSIYRRPSMKKHCIKFVIVMFFRGYYVRAKACEHMLEQFLAMDGKKQVVIPCYYKTTQVCGSVK